MGAIRLWAHAFHTTTHSRRDNFLSQLDPKYMSMLRKGKYFKPKESDAIFGERFLDKLYKKKRRDSQIHPNPASSSNSRRNSNFRSYRRTPYGGGNQSYNQSPNSISLRGRGRGRGRYVTQPPQFPVLFVHNAAVPPAGRTRLCADAWRSITKDPWVISTVSLGLLIEFTRYPSQEVEPVALRMSRDQLEVCDKEVENLVGKGAITMADESIQGFISTLFAVPKKPSGFRPILNLKDLNCSVTYNNFKLEHIEQARYLLKKNDWLAKIDLKDAYLTIPVHPEHRRFLRCQCP